GIGCMVLEAMGRVGGRAHMSSREFGVPFDVGCAWLHAADRNPFYPDAQAAGWTLKYHDMGLDHLYFGSRKATREEFDGLVSAEARLQQPRAQPEGPDDRLVTHAIETRLEVTVSTYNSTMDFGKDDDEISVTDFRGAEDLEPNYLTQEGFGALVAHWGRDVPVEL